MADEATGTQGNTEEATIATEASTQPVEAPQTPVETPTEQAPVVAPVEEKPEEGGLLSNVEDSGDTVPETYEFEGLEALDEKSLADIQTFAKENKLTSAEAQTSANAVKHYQDSLVAESTAFAAENRAAFEADPKGKENLLLAEKGLKHLGMLDGFTGRGHDSDYSLVKIAAEVGRFLSEAKTVTGAETAPHGAVNPYNNSPEFK